MSATNLTWALILAFLLAFLLGWVARWIYNKLNLQGPLASDEMMRELRETQAELRQKEQEFLDTEQQYARAYSQLEAELEAAMTGLGDARREAQELRTKL